LSIVGQGQKDEKICEERMEKRKNLTWSASMEEKLLELRLGVFQQNFLDAANRKDVQKGWELVRGKFIEAYPSLEQSVSVEKLKNKFQNQNSNWSPMTRRPVTESRDSKSQVLPLIQIIGKFSICTLPDAMDCQTLILERVASFTKI